ncbi:multiple inositol polyphosphate phosphatase 1-like [Armigeres subalbatus]|uniref:multiple inositol polyphosphate phosphatase 1-like n=1 Tax=Armigeres subalbatus TaxID=124917 RepID=UPI002ED60D51
MMTRSSRVLQIIPIVLSVLLASQLVVQAAKSSFCCEDYCYSRDRHRSQSKHFATKTAYEVVRGSASSKDHIVPNCTPTKFWLLSRHGTRLMGEKDIASLPQALNTLRDLVLDNYNKRRTAPNVGRLCTEDLNLLRSWRWDSNITTGYGSFLTNQGWNDLKFLAGREKDRYPELFNGTYDKQRYLFRHTNTQRTEASFKAFVEGLFGDEAYNSIDATSDPSDDTLLKAYDFCPAYDANKDKNDEPNSEASKFLQSRLYIQTLSEISKRLGFDYTLSTEQVEDLWDACRFEQAWHPYENSPWCSVFTKNQVDVLEYKEDLKYYYQNSYGYKESSNLACFTVADMITQLGGVDGQQVIAYFTHESKIQIFLAALGAKRDKNALRADNYFSMRHRKFKSSELTPFASNVAVVRYQCSDPVEPVKVKFFLNEKVLKLDWCRGELCDWSKVVRYLERFTSGDCATMYCSGSDASNGTLG